MHNSFLPSDAVLSAGAHRLRQQAGKPHQRLVDLLKVDVCDEHKRRLQFIDEEDYSGVVKKVRESYEEIYGVAPTEEYLRSGVLGLKQYYAVALLDPLNAHSVSEKLDLFWHSHILNSRRYIKFCDNVVGSYMHHLPLDRDSGEQMENISTLYDYTLEVLTNLFGEVSRENWPMPNSPAFKLMCSHASDYPPVNHLGLFPAEQRGVYYAEVA